MVPNGKFNLRKDDKVHVNFKFEVITSYKKRSVRSTGCARAKPGVHPRTVAKIHSPCPSNSPTRPNQTVLNTPTTTAKIPIDTNARTDGARRGAPV